MVEFTNNPQKNFGAEFNGYKRAEADELIERFLKEQDDHKREVSDLMRKMEILADKIREYKLDEDVLKDSILVAKREANRITAETKEKIAEQQQAADEKTAKEIADAVEKRNGLIADGNEKVAAAVAEAADILEEAREQARKLNADVNAHILVQKEVLAQLQLETKEYTQRANEAYRSHIERQNAIPSLCESDFSQRVLHEYAKLKSNDDHNPTAFAVRLNEIEKGGVAASGLEEKAERLVKQSKGDDVFKKPVTTAAATPGKKITEEN
ncbi:MAG: DivIVA domain-containing protein [Oscillospiraceae bacterium]|jgi:cell division septum initiation protein DivIVA|nr:DivIVA domain-containing protein [Oscillospiraceae bacterium]